MKVLRYRPMKGRKDYECVSCRRKVEKGWVHMLVTMDDGGPYPVTKRCCYRCFEAGRIAKGRELQ